MKHRHPFRFAWAAFALFLLSPFLLATKTPPPGRSIPGTEARLILEEKFDSPAPRFVKPSPYLLSSVVENELHLEGLIDKTLFAREIIPIHTQSFEIEANVSLWRSENSAPVHYGIAFGFDADNNGYGFCIRGEGKLSVLRFEGSKATELVAISSGEVKWLRAGLTLAVLKTPKTWQFYVGEVMVHEMNSLPFMGQETGFVVGGKTQINADFIRIRSFVPIDKQPPVIYVQSPDLQNKTALSLPFAELKGVIKDNSDRMPLASLNGTALQLDAAGNFSCKVELSPGLNYFELKARDEAGNETEGISFNLEYKPKHEKGKNYLLLIGVDKYVHWSPLKNAVFDCQGIANVLYRRYRFDPSHTIRLYNDDFSHTNLIRTLEYLEDLIGSNDNLLIYFAGHGSYDKPAERGAWVPGNARKDAVEDYIPNRIIQDYMRSIKSKNTLLIADACYAGSLLSATRGDIFLGNISRWAITSGGLEKVPDGLEGEHSPFARALIEVLSKSSERLLRADDLFRQLEQRLDGKTPSQPQGNSIKNVGDEGGVYYFELRN